MATALQLFTKFAAVSCAQNLPNVIPIHIALFTPNLRVVWKDLNISQANSGAWGSVVVKALRY